MQKQSRANDVVGPEGLPHGNDINALAENGTGDQAAENLEVLSGTVPLSRGKLDELRGRVVSAKGPDRQLDTDLCVALGYVPQVPDAKNVRHSTHAAYDLDGTQPWVTYARPPHLTGFSVVPAITGSVDAAIAILERMLPGWERTNGHADTYDGYVGYECILWKYGPDGSPQPFSYAATEPLAILAAMLAALTGKEG